MKTGNRIQAMSFDFSLKLISSYNILGEKTRQVAQVWGQNRFPDHLVETEHLINNLNQDKTSQKSLPSAFNI